MTTKDNYETIKEAIKNKKQIHAEYKGKHRKMCPHVIGTKNEIKHALFYQFGGSSSSGLNNDGRDWRCIKVDELQSIEIKDGDWHTGEVLTNNRSNCIDEIDREVDW